MTSSLHLLSTPALVDAHIHPDKTSWGGPWMQRRAARSIQDLITNDEAAQAEFERDVETRAYALMSHAVRNGTLAMRAHADVSSSLGTRNVEGVRAAAERLPMLDVQIVAFPQAGLLVNPGTLEALEAAMELGADLVGGIDPVGVDGDLDGHLDAIFGLADRFGRGLDIHLHTKGEDGLAQTREIARRTIDSGRAGLKGAAGVTISHAFALCDNTLESQKMTLDLVAEAGIAITTVAGGRAPIPDFARFAEHGVRIGVGSDGVRDAWSPFGTGSMVDRAHLLGYRTGATTDEDLERVFALASTGGAEVLGLEDWTDKTRLEFAAEHIAQLVVDRPAPVRVYRDDSAVNPQ